MSRSKFPKSLRLLRPAEFERVFAARNSASNVWLVLYAATNDLGYPRLGLTVSRKVGGAVQRNRWKRLLREAFRTTQESLPVLDFICLPRAATPPALDQLKSSMFDLATRLDRKSRKRPPQAPRIV